MTPTPDAPGRDAILVNLEDARALLGGISREAFDDHVRPRLRVRYIGRRAFVSAEDLRRYVAGL